MAYVPDFRYDLFLSYAETDNANRWVDAFAAALTAELHQSLGNPFSPEAVFLDKWRIHTGQSRPKEMDAAAEDSAILVALVSPAYLTSNRCSQDRTAFRRKLPLDASFADSLTRVDIHPCDELPRTLRDAHAASFLIPGQTAPWDPGSAGFAEAIQNLARQLKASLRSLRRRYPSVFLGPALPADPHLRDRVEGYLAAEGFRAEPAVSMLDEDADALEALAQANAAVCLLGDGNGLATRRLQDALQHGTGPVLVFHPFGAPPLSVEEQAILDANPPRLQVAGRSEPALRTTLTAMLVGCRTPKPSPVVPFHVPEPPKPGGLEKLTRGGRFRGYGLWNEQLQRCAKALCHIRVADGSGTGFLIAPQYVLTAYHVVAPVVQAQFSLAQVQCIFNYQETAAGIHSDPPLAIEAIVAHSPYSHADLGPNNGLPSPKELDFALLRLAAPVSHPPVNLQEATDAPSGDFTVILQHPDGKPLQLTWGMLQPRVTPLRTRYNADTLPGSSGSLVLDEDLRPIALHHAGDPRSIVKAEYNQGIPLRLIRDAIEANPAVPDL